MIDAQRRLMQEVRLRAIIKYRLARHLDSQGAGSPPPYQLMTLAQARAMGLVPAEPEEQQFADPTTRH